MACLAGRAGALPVAGAGLCVVFHVGIVHDLCMPSKVIGRLGELSPNSPDDLLFLGGVRTGGLNVIASGFAVHGWSDASDIAQVILALAAAVGVPFAIVQLRRQGTASRLAVGDRLDARWNARLAQAERNLVAALGVEKLPGASEVLGRDSIEIARRHYVEGNADIGIRADHVGRVIPYVLLSLLPSNPRIGRPKENRRTKTNTKHSWRNVVSSCSRYSTSSSKAKTRHAISDLSTSLALVEGYVNVVNDVAEMIEQGDLNLCVVSW